MKKQFLAITSEGQTEFVAYKNITACRLDPVNNTAFFRFRCGRTTFVKNIENMSDVIELLKAVEIPETDEEEPQRRLNRKQRRELKQAVAS